jgi:hypothetical protein
MKLLMLRARAQTKKDLMIYIALLLGFFFFTGPAPTNVHADNTFVTIGTGGVAGLYYHTGKAIAKIVNKKNKEYGLQVKVEFTGASVFNVNAMMMGDLEFGIVQSDRQYQAWHGIKDWKDRGAQKKLRSICSFYPESVVLVAADDAGIDALLDLKGKLVNIGNLGSGARGNAIDAMQSCGLDWRRELSVEGFRVADAAKMLQDRKLNAFFHTIGHPNDLIKEVTEGKRKVRLVPLNGNCIDQLVAKWPYYAKASIPISFYPMAQNKKNVETFGVKATFCTSADIPESAVYAITREIFNDLEDFKKLHPAYGVLTKQNMLETLSAPIHPGALKYYKEAGLTIPPSPPVP